MKIHLKTLLAVAALAALAPLPVLADGDHGAHKPAAGAMTAASDLTEGEVRKIDMEAGKVTLKHADIKNLDMPGMTMVFVVKDKAMLDRLKAGDKVKFEAVNDAGKLTLTDIQPMP